MLSFQNSPGTSFEAFLFELDDDDLYDDDPEDEYSDLDDLDYDNFEPDLEEEFDYVNANGNGDADGLGDDDYIH